MKVGQGVGSGGVFVLTSLSLLLQHPFLGSGKATLSFGFVCLGRDGMGRLLNS